MSVRWMLWTMAVAGIVFGPAEAFADVSGPKTEPLSIMTSKGAREFQVEVARTDEEQRLGLMFRTSLPQDRGMLFVYDPPQEITMWMRNTRIPLDMVFIAADGRVLRIARETEPYSLDVIASKGTAAAVLEINGGLSQKLGIQPGDQVRHPAFPVAGTGTAR